MCWNSSWTSRNASTISALMNIPGVPTFSHDASCIISVRERSAQIMPENAIVTTETVKKRIALPISWVTRTHSLHDHRQPIPYVLVIIPLILKFIFLYSLYKKGSPYQDRGSCLYSTLEIRHIKLRPDGVPMIGLRRSSSVRRFKL